MYSIYIGFKLCNILQPEFSGATTRGSVLFALGPARHRILRFGSSLDTCSGCDGNAGMVPYKLRSQNAG